jgi:hypothetical protein
MTNTFDEVDIVWTKLNNSSLKTAITGAIYKNRRPAGSDKEDIVINALPVNNADIQQGIVNVNIHVPNLTVSANGTVDNNIPNHTRLKELTVMALAILADNWEEGINYDVQQQNLLMDDTGTDHFVNIRLLFNAINLSTF